MSEKLTLESMNYKFVSLKVWGGATKGPIPNTSSKGDIYFRGEKLQGENLLAFVIWLFLKLFMYMKTSLILNHYVAHFPTTNISSGVYVI